MIGAVERIASETIATTRALAGRLGIGGGSAPARRPTVPIRSPATRVGRTPSRKSFSFFPRSFSFLAKSYSFFPESFSFLARSYSFFAESFSFSARSYSFFPESFSFFARS
jgi:hypothetical protein